MTEFEKLFLCVLAGLFVGWIAVAPVGPPDCVAGSTPALFTNCKVY